MMASRFG